MSDMKPHYGTSIHGPENSAIVLSPSDFLQHQYIIAMSGAGKTAIQLNEVKHLEMANQTKELPNAIIYFDLKGDDAYKLLMQTHPETVKSGNLHYLDPIETGFSINPLELPPYEPEDKDMVVSRFVGYFMDTLKEWFQQGSAVFVSMERIFKLLLHFLYHYTDSPTFLDLYDLMLRIRNKEESAINLFYEIFDKPSLEMQMAMDDLSKLKDESYSPLINRIEQFATDPILKKLFCVQKSTVDFDKLLEPGNITIIRLSELNISKHVRPLALQSMILKTWFAILERANRITMESKRTTVVLFIDEFQVAQDLTVLKMMLSQSRAFRLGLVLAHQNTDQLNNDLFGAIVGNCSTVFSGRVSGIDAARMGKVMDPKFSTELTNQLAAQSDYVFTVKVRAPPGEEQPAPITFNTLPPPEYFMNDSQLQEFIAQQKTKYGYGKVKVPLLTTLIEHGNEWKLQSASPFLTQIEWEIICSLEHGPKIQTAINLDLDIKNRNGTKAALKKMIDDGWLYTLSESRKLPHTLTKKAISEFIDMDFSTIGKKTSNADMIAIHACKYYRKNKMYVALANQNWSKGKNSTDIVAYDYSLKKAISVEIESHAEAASHYDGQVRYNMKKWTDLGFDLCHVWSTNKAIKKAWANIDPDLQNKVKLFLLGNKIK